MTILALIFLSYHFLSEDICMQLYNCTFNHVSEFSEFMKAIISIQNCKVSLEMGEATPT